MARVKQAARKHASARFAKELVAKRKLAVKMNRSWTKWWASNPQDENCSASSNAAKTSDAAKVTNKILVCGPCLHPEQVDPNGSQIEDLQTFLRKRTKCKNIV